MIKDDIQFVHSHFGGPDFFAERVSATSNIILYNSDIIKPSFILLRILSTVCRTDKYYFIL